MSELDAAKAIINGEAPSPFKLGDSLWLCVHNCPPPRPHLAPHFVSM